MTRSHPLGLLLTLLGCPLSRHHIGAVNDSALRSFDQLIVAKRRK